VHRITDMAGDISKRLAERLVLYSTRDSAVRCPSAQTSCHGLEVVKSLGAGWSVGRDIEARMEARTIRGHLMRTTP
jgi:hypothetical protein